MLLKLSREKYFSSSSGEDSSATTSHAQVLHFPLSHLDPFPLLLMRRSVLPSKEPIEKPGAELLIISNCSTVKLIKAVFTLLDYLTAKHQIPDELPPLQQKLLALTSFCSASFLAAEKKQQHIFHISIHEKLIGHQAEAVKPVCWRFGEMLELSGISSSACIHPQTKGCKPDLNSDADVLEVMRGKEKYSCTSSGWIQVKKTKQNSHAFQTVGASLRILMSRFLRKHRRCSV